MAEIANNASPSRQNEGLGAKTHENNTPAPDSRISYQKNNMSRGTSKLSSQGSYKLPRQVPLKKKSSQGTNYFTNQMKFKDVSPEDSEGDRTPKKQKKIHFDTIDIDKLNKDPDSVIDFELMESVKGGVSSKSDKSTQRVVVNGNYAEIKNADGKSSYKIYKPNKVSTRMTTSATLFTNQKHNLIFLFK